MTESRLHQQTALWREALDQLITDVEAAAAEEARLAAARIAALEEANAKLLRQPNLVFERIKNSLDELRSVRTEELLSTLIELLSESFAAVSVFAVKGKTLRLWKHRGGDAAAAQAHVPFESESPLARAARHRTTVTEETTMDAGAAAQGGMPRVNVIALPVLAHGRVMAVVYAENPEGHSVDRLRMAETIAEILVGCVNQRLSRTESSIDLDASVQSPRSAQPASSASESPQSDQYAVSRQAPRVKVTGAVDVLIDGVTSTLIDLSALGVQIMSPTALRPNRCVRVALACANGRLTCEGRIVWAQLESARAQTSAMYRAGVRFVDVNPGAITTLVSQYGPPAAPAVKRA